MSLLDRALHSTRLILNGCSKHINFLFLKRKKAEGSAIINKDAFITVELLVTVLQECIYGVR